MNRRVHRLQHYINARNIDIEHVDTDKNPSVILTKPSSFGRITVLTNHRPSTSNSDRQALT